MMTETAVVAGLVHLRPRYRSRKNVREKKAAEFVFRVVIAS